MSTNTPQQNHATIGHDEWTLVAPLRYEGGSVPRFGIEQHYEECMEKATGGFATRDLDQTIRAGTALEMNDRGPEETDQ